MHKFILLIYPNHSFTKSLDPRVESLNKSYDTLSRMGKTPIIIIQGHKPINEMSGIVDKLIIPLVILLT
jgi:hypothetical protein